MQGWRNQKQIQNINTEPRLTLGSADVLLLVGLLKGFCPASYTNHWTHANSRHKGIIDAGMKKPKTNAELAQGLLLRLIYKPLNTCKLTPTHPPQKHHRSRDEETKKQIQNINTELQLTLDSVDVLLLVRLLKSFCPASYTNHWTHANSHQQIHHKGIIDAGMKETKNKSRAKDTYLRVDPLPNTYRRYVRQPPNHTPNAIVSYLYRMHIIFCIAHSCWRRPNGRNQSRTRSKFLFSITELLRSRASRMEAQPCLPHEPEATDLSNEEDYSIGCIQSVDWTSGLDYWTHRFVPKAHWTAPETYWEAQQQTLTELIDIRARGNGLET